MTHAKHVTQIGPPERYRGFVLAMVDDGHGLPYAEVYYEGQFAEGAPADQNLPGVREWVDRQWDRVDGDPVRLDALMGIVPG
jgi:hypothetical protein